MPRAVVLANRRTFLAWDDGGRLVDATWPRVGFPNHLLGRPCRVGVAIGRSFAWLDEAFDAAAAYEPRSSVARWRFASRRLGLEIGFRDALHPDADLLVREVTARNLRPKAREARLFLHHDFTLSQSDVGDTVLKDPASGGLLHYKDDVVALVNADAVQSWACGVKGFRGLEGTWRDAEDGQLAGNPCAHGSVDSTLAVPLRLPPSGEASARTWLAFASDFPGAWKLDALARRRPGQAARRAAAAARAALAAAPRPAPGLPPGAAELYERSVLLMRVTLDAGGGLAAAVDSDILTFNRDTYAYVWPRDAAFVANALDLAGAHDEAGALLDFVAGCPTWDGALMHKYTLAGRPASTWHAWERNGEAELPVQEDETGLVLWALARHLAATRRRPGPRWAAFVRPAADFLVAYRDERGVPLPSWDLWEERRGTLLFTCAATVAGLRAAAEMARAAKDARAAARYAQAAEATARASLAALWMPAAKRYARMIGEDGEPDPTPDASMFALTLLAPADDPRVRATLDHVFAACAVPGPVGGVARYPGDLYHRTGEEGPGNPWVMPTLWGGLWAQAKGDADGLRRALAWCVTRASGAGHLAEQVHPGTGEPLSVSPLAWSHAAFVEATIAAGVRSPAARPRERGPAARSRSGTGRRRGPARSVG